MGPLDDLILQNILRTDSSGKVLQKEDDKIEYKEVFDNSSKDAKAKYAKEMAALYNYEGGYLIFGISDSSDLIGLQSFVEPDNADLANDLNAYFSPAIRFRSRLIKVDGKDLFVVYVEKRSSIPTVCIKGHQDTLKESTIYWRYSAKSAPIHAGDLINLLNSLRGEETLKLAEIAERDFRSKSKPRLWLNGGMRSGGEFKIRIENKGEVAYLDSFDVTESDIGTDKIILHKWGSSVAIEKERGIQISGQINKSDPSYVCFQMILRYHDQENYMYETLIEWNHGHSKIIKTTEL